MSIHEFLAMGGHGPYIWPSYAAAFAVIVLILVRPVIRERRILREVARAKRRGTRK